MTKAEERYERIETLKSGNGENSSRIRPKANNIRVNFIAGVTALTFNESCRPPTCGETPVRLSFHVNEFLQHFIAGRDDLCVGLICPLGDDHFYKFGGQVDV